MHSAVAIKNKSWYHLIWPTLLYFTVHVKQTYLLPAAVKIHFKTILSVTDPANIVILGSEQLR